ncbi:MAG: valine--tRNA ligase [Deltaproteobacteria bacterium]|jgi:valyl-tRNA synthetase|nr:valine--tRNA ligase [Deltaproteobacteria bacterium]
MCSSSDPLTKNFDHHEAEGRIYSLWEKSAAFRADPEKGGDPFVIVIPPPNVTGNLHMGHALDNTLQDILTRYHRMLGDNALWVPGTDHAGIATQAVVERHLAGEGVSRLDLGREKFLERVWKWKEEYGGRIIGQLKRLGASCDWSRERFTMDFGLSRAVREVFVSLHEEGLIYRGDYVVNWCPRCRTAISDIEVEHEDRDDSLYYILYQGVNGGPSLTVATTRPETLFGDTAVAVNPQDSRYPRTGDFQVRLPLTDRVIPLIRDAHVDPEFGTGALKVTPAHDLNDFQIGKRHNLPIVSCVNQEGLLTAAAGPYQGLDAASARKKVAEDLEARGLLVKTEPLRHAVGLCYRCRTLIEPLISLQWFVKTAPLAKAAKEAVEEGRIRLVPQSWERTFFDWMDNIRDWCVSRQLWWGHRIPAWYCVKCGKTVVSRGDPSRCPDCGGGLERDQDVLDTWFSSALWPFSTLGWPDKTPDFQRYYPTTVLVTGFDIIFFWVARMMMMGLKMTGRVPFRTVVLHPLVRDASGRKMSKSKGNVIDPLTLIDAHGADAFRFALAAQAGTARDLKISEERVQGCSRFVNKLWNAARFSLSHIANLPTIPGPLSLDLPSRWIRSRLNSAAKDVGEFLNSFHFDRAADRVYRFFWDEFCDWYLELIKPALYGKDGEARESVTRSLYGVFSAALKLLHPFTPFVTEELWGKLPRADALLTLSAFPREDPEKEDQEAEREIGRLMDLAKAVRQARADFRVPPGVKLSPAARPRDPATAALIEEHSSLLLKLTGADSIRIAKETEAPPLDAARTAFAWGEVWIPLSGRVDLRKEEERIRAEKERLEKDAEKARAKLQNPGYLAKAPAEVVEETRERLEEMIEKLKAAEKSLELMEGMRRNRD